MIKLLHFLPVLLILAYLLPVQQPQVLVVSITHANDGATQAGKQGDRLSASAAAANAQGASAEWSIQDTYHISRTKSAVARTVGPHPATAV